MDNIFLTGQIQTGKSTLIRRLLAELGDIRIGGFRTLSLGGGGTTPAGVYIFSGDPHIEPRPSCECMVGQRLGQGRYTAFPQVFDTLGTELLHKAGPFDILLMDELGMMENGAPLFRQAVLELLEGDTPILGVVKPQKNPLTDAVRAHKRTKLFEVTVQNRDELFPLLLEKLLKG